MLLYIHNTWAPKDILKSVNEDIRANIRRLQWNEDFFLFVAAAPHHCVLDMFAHTGY